MPGSLLDVTTRGNIHPDRCHACIHVCILPFKGTLWTFLRCYHGQSGGRPGPVLCVAGQIIPRTKRNTTAVRVKETCHFSCRSFPRLHFVSTITVLWSPPQNGTNNHIAFHYHFWRFCDYIYIFLWNRIAFRFRVANIQGYGFKDMAVPSLIDAKMFFQETYPWKVEKRISDLHSAIRIWKSTITEVRIALPGSGKRCSDNCNLARNIHGEFEELIVFYFCSPFSADLVPSNKRNNPARQTLFHRVWLHSSKPD